MSRQPVVLDASTFLSSAVTINRDGVTVDGNLVEPGRGWLRRLAPEMWTQPIGSPGLDGVERSAAVSALASIARDDRFAWLTSLDALGGSENKPFQYRRIARAEIPVPEWIVTTDPTAVPQEGSWIAKPLGPGAFIDESGNGRVVPAQPVDTDNRSVITRVPFILQRTIRARTHARVVTVSSVVRSATLDAAGLPLDWRTSHGGHYGFTPKPAPDHVHRFAVRAASASGVNYSSQDWIEDVDGNWWFVDLNPAGQWLFLPDAVADDITAAIANYLDG